MPDAVAATTGRNGGIVTTAREGAMFGNVVFA
jgi:hypothetical protein